MKHSYDAILSRLIVLFAAGLLCWQCIPPQTSMVKPMLAQSCFLNEELPFLPVVMYHRVSNRTLPNDGGRVLPVLEFEEQLMFLRDAGYTTLFASDYHKIRKGVMPCPDKPIMLTFDDGYDDNLLEAYPLLRRYRIRANFYIITGSIGANGHMTERQLQRIDPRFVEIGSHTVNHCNLRDCYEKRLHRELVDSRLALEFLLGRTIDTFAFPYGGYDDKAVAMAKKAGYKVAFTTERGTNDWNDEGLTLKRVTVARGMPLSLFKRAIGAIGSSPRAD